MSAGQHGRMASDVEVVAASLPALFTKRSLAEFLQVHPATVDRAVVAGRLRAIRIGTQVRFRPDDVDAYLEGLAAEHDQELKSRLADEARGQRRRRR